MSSNLWGFAQNTDARTGAVPSLYLSNALDLEKHNNESERVKKRIRKEKKAIVEKLITRNVTKLQEKTLSNETEYETLKKKIEDLENENLCLKERIYHFENEQK
ncbi:hypothetical protein HUJ04_003999 [Dendroctonus ponderosae]|nr:hypothetical protein HUJ04_003999 [Dendroctonus ponderosae]